MYRYHCLNPISQVGLETFTEEYVPVSEPEKADAILVRSTNMKEMEFAKELKAIARAGAGVNNIPLGKCSEQGIAVFNTPGANANGVKEMVIAGMLLASRDIVGGIEWLEKQEATDDIAKLAEKKKKQFAGCEISGKKLGIIGLGAIGVKVANAAVHLGMDVYGYDPFISVDAAWNLSRSIHHINDLNVIYKECDYITIHVPLLDSTKKMIGADEIAQMKAELEKSLYFTVKDSNGKYITATGADGVYTYNGESTSEFKYVLKNSTFTIAELPTGDYTITEYSTLLDYTIKSENPVKITVVRNQTATATFINERDTGNASIVKKWTNHNGLTTAQKAELEKNVYFTIKNADGAYLKAVSKNGKYVYNGSQTAEARFMLTNGKFELTELPTGKYTITEINNAEGYLPKTQVKTITVTKDATASAEFVNKVIVGNVTLTKVDEDYPENKLTGAIFTVYKSDKKTVVGTLKETETGVYSLEGLVYGEYYVQETKAPEYFVRDVNFYYFQIVNDGETVEVSNDELGKGTFINSPQKGEIKIVKTSYDNKVEGFHFEVTGKTYTGQSFSKIYTTDKNGIIRINDLRAGEYTVHEVKDSASAGYLLPEDKQLTIDRDGAMLVANMHNSKLPDNPPTGASEDSFTQTAVIIISMVMMSAAVVLVFPLSKRKRKR